MREFDYLRNFRNKLVHNPASISKEELNKMTGNLEYLIHEYKKAIKMYKHNAGQNTEHK